MSSKVKSWKATWIAQLPLRKVFGWGLALSSVSRIPFQTDVKVLGCSYLAKSRNVYFSRFALHSKMLVLGGANQPALGPRSCMKTGFPGSDCRNAGYKKNVTAHWLLWQRVESTEHWWCWSLFSWIQEWPSSACGTVVPAWKNFSLDAKVWGTVEHRTLTISQSISSWIQEGPNTAAGLCSVKKLHLTAQVLWTACCFSIPLENRRWSCTTEPELEGINTTVLETRSRRIYTAATE